jgi:hypothetical protein
MAPSTGEASAMTTSAIVLIVASRCVAPLSARFAPATFTK